MPGSTATVLGFVMELVVNSSVVTGLSVPVYPRELQGIWFTDDPGGHTQCRAFLSANKKNGNASFDLLTGSQVISSSLWHSVAEYGEGNFYQLRRISKVGAQVWRMEADVGIDSYPEGLESQRAMFEVKIAKRRLLWWQNSLNDQSGDKQRRFFRCTAVPEGFRRY